MKIFAVLYVVYISLQSIQGRWVDIGNQTEIPSDDVMGYNTTLGEDPLEFKPSQIYMDRLCNTNRVLHDRNALLMSPWSSKHPPSTYSCKVGVESGSYTNYRFVVTFAKMELSSATGSLCEHSRLDLYNGVSVSISDRLSGAAGLCGKREITKSYETTTNFLTLLYSTKNLGSSTPQYFEAVITPFHFGKCLHDEFKCHNHKCIQQNMLCDGYDNCGDDSDEKHCGAIALSVAAIVGIVVGAVLLLIIIIIICVCCNICCCACGAYESL